jgi:hypothetical protein
MRSAHRTETEFILFSLAEMSRKYLLLADDDVVAKWELSHGGNKQINNKVTTAAAAARRI